MTDRAPIQIHLAGLLHSIEDHCGFTHYYLDRETGEILYQSEHRCGDDTDGPPCDAAFPGEDAAERFLHIEPMDGRRGVDIMKDFIASLPDGAVAARLSSAMAKRAPYRNFKDALHTHPEIEKKWQREFSEQIGSVAAEWLRHNNVDFEFVNERGLPKHDG